jgi:hypothetical protein
MHVEVPAITRAEMLADEGQAETSAVVAARVAAARRRAAQRYAGTPWRTNGQVPPVELRRRWPVSRSSSADADRALELGALTARGYGRVLRLAWTLADLAEVDVPGPEHVGHALRFRLGPDGGGRVSADEQVLALLALSRVTEPGSRPVHRAVQAQGAVAVWHALRSGRPCPPLSPPCRRRPRAGRGLRPRRTTSPASSGAADGCCTPGHPEWPPSGSTGPTGCCTTLRRWRCASAVRTRSPR